MVTLHEARYTFLTTSRSVLLRMRNISDKLVDKTKTRILCSVTFFRKSCRLWDNVEKYCSAGQGTDDDKLRRRRFARSKYVLRLKCDGTRAETRFRLSAKWTSPFKSAGASVQSTTGSRGVRISGSNAGFTMFRSSVKSTGYPLHSPVSPSLALPCVTVCHHISTGL
jgi:hypothetical protein